VTRVLPLGAVILIYSLRIVIKVLSSKLATTILEPNALNEPTSGMFSSHISYSEWLGVFNYPFD